MLINKLKKTKLKNFYFIFDLLLMSKKDDDFI